MTLIDGEQVADWMEMTELDRQARERVQVEGGDVNPGGGISGFDVMGMLGSFKSPSGCGLGEDEIGMKCTYLIFKSLFSPSRIIMEAHSLPMLSLVS